MNLLDLPPDEPTTAEELKARTRRVRALRQEMRQPRAVMKETEPEPSPPPQPAPKPKRKHVETIPNFLAFRHNGYVNPYEPDEPRISVKAIVEETAKHFGISVAGIVSKLRTRRFVDARHVAVYLSKKLTRNSYVQIGKRIGDLDHTSILHAVHRIQAKIDTYDEAIAKAVIEIEKRVLAS